MAIGSIWRSKVRVFASALLLRDLIRVPIIKESSSSSISPSQFSFETEVPTFNSYESFSKVFNLRFYHDGRPRGSLWRGKKLLGKEAIFVTLALKRLKDDEVKLDKFIKTHVLRLLKMDLIAVLNELERQEEVALAVKVFLFLYLSHYIPMNKFQCVLRYFLPCLHNCHNLF